MNSMWCLTSKNEGACKCIRGGERERLLLVRRVGNGEGSVSHGGDIGADFKRCFVN